MKVRTLPGNVINKIAAGEVIERPASVVKELVENSLDAGAAYINIDIENAGLKKIAVRDDGCGMEKEDLILSVKPHTTSKIACVEDLLQIHTLGFRGEALASIAAVADCVLKSKVKEKPFGSQLLLQSGAAQKISSIGMPNGTSIIVRHLFADIPARKKFLKTNATELHHILDNLTRLSLAHPSVGFRLQHNRKIIFEMPPCKIPEERLHRILGDYLFSGMIPLKYSDKYISIEGFIGKPQYAAKTNSKQYLIVNNRPVENNLVAQAVRDAYATLLEAAACPLFLLMLSIPADSIDINIHPRKEEIRFMTPKTIYGSIRNAVDLTLRKHNIIYQQSFSFKDESRATAKILRENLSPWSPKLKLEKNQEVLQVHRLYLVVQTLKGLLIVDQHAAHERILYEQFLASFKLERQKAKSTIVKPLTIDLTSSEFVLLEEYLDILIKLGFRIEPFGSQTIKVTEVPELFSDRDIPLLISEILSDITLNRPQSVDDRSQLTISYLACRSAIKAGDILSSEERRDLINKLFRTKTQYTCPHGRPVQIEIAINDLGKMFKRS